MLPVDIAECTSFHLLGSQQDNLVNIRYCVEIKWVHNQAINIIINIIPHKISLPRHSMQDNKIDKLFHLSKNLFDSGYNYANQNHNTGCIQEHKIDKIILKYMNLDNIVLHIRSN